MRERQGRCYLLCRQCAVLRAEVVRRKDEAERERCQAREAAALLRQLELRMEGLATHTDMTLGTKEQAFEQVRSAVRPTAPDKRRTDDAGGSDRDRLWRVGSTLTTLSLLFRRKLS